MLLHRSAGNFPSTAWGPGSCPDCVHRARCRYSIRPGQLPGDLWSTVIHSLWIRIPSTAPPPGCPPPTHRISALVPRRNPLLHTSVHCSATRHPSSLSRVKAVTPRRSIGLWGTGVKLGTALGRSTPVLCIGCAELPCVHRSAWLSTDRTHRGGGQKTGSDLRKRRYPRFPQGLLLLPLRVSQESASKWGLCTTLPAELSDRFGRLDPEQRRVSAPYVRLDPGVRPGPSADGPESTTRPAGRASNSRRRFR